MSKKIEELLAVNVIDLKWLFDHFRNYGIAGGLMYAAKHVATTPSVSPIPYFGWFAAASFFLISIGLFTFNFVQGMNALKVFRGKLPGKWVYVVGFLIWFLLMQELLGIKLSGAA